jgi:hypothetical protein
LFLRFTVLHVKQSGRVAEDLSEMVTVNTVSDGQGKEFWPVDQAPEKQAPVVKLVFFQDAKDNNGSQ